MSGASMSELKRIQIGQVLIGADPEVFVRGPEGLVSGHIFKCGSKERPKKTRHGAVQVDGMALEFNTKPAASEQEFIQAIQSVLNDLHEIIAKKGQGYVIDPVTTALFGSEYISQQPLKARILGCNADYSAYTMSENRPPNMDLPFRTGAGHVHIGWRRGPITPEHFEMCGLLSRELDYYLGIPSFDWDHDDKRREMYGKAGAFRPKTYGVEYRVLSNAWIFRTKLVSTVYSQTIAAIENINRGYLMSEMYGTLAQEYIDSNGGIVLPNEVLEAVYA